MYRKEWGGVGVMAEEENLSNGLNEIMDLAKKYNFEVKDMEFLLDRILLLAEAMTLIETLGLSEELVEKHRKACERTVETMNKLWVD